MAGMREYLMLFAFEEAGEEKEELMPIKAYSTSQAEEIAKLLCRQNGYRFLSLELAVVQAG